MRAISIKWKKKNKKTTIAYNCHQFTYKIWVSSARTSLLNCSVSGARHFSYICFCSHSPLSSPVHFYFYASPNRIYSVFFFALFDFGCCSNFMLPFLCGYVWYVSSTYELIQRRMQAICIAAFILKEKRQQRKSVWQFVFLCVWHWLDILKMGLNCLEIFIEFQSKYFPISVDHMKFFQEKYECVNCWTAKPMHMCHYVTRLFIKNKPKSQTALEKLLNTKKQINW